MKRCIERLEGWLEAHPKARPWVWFAGLWLAGLAAVAGLSYGIRAVMKIWV